MGTVLVGLVLALIVFALGFAVHFLWLGALVFVVVWIAGMAPREHWLDEPPSAPGERAPAPTSLEEG